MLRNPAEPRRYKSKVVAMKSAIIIGASSGIGRELAKILSNRNYQVGLAARRLDLLRSLQEELPNPSWARAIDVRDRDNTQSVFAELVSDMGDVDLVVISAGTGYLNPELDVAKELDTVATNVQGFTVVANLVVRHFLAKGSGHLVGISSVAAIRGSGHAPAYNASKAFISNYLQGLAQKAARSGLAITVTEVQPGFVDTDMAKGDGLFWVAPARTAAQQIYEAIEKKRSHVYVTKRWRAVGWLLKIMPTVLYNRMP